MKTTKKAILVIVEGPSDKNALALALQSLFESIAIKTFIVYGDLTVRTPEFMRDDGSNVVNIVSAIFKKNLEQTKLKIGDFLAVFQIADLDGVYLDDAHVILDKEAIKPSYSEKFITTHDPVGIVRRNSFKRRNLRKLMAHTALLIKGHRIPFYIFYMSCNLEHALWGKFNCSDLEKEQFAHEFARACNKDRTVFVKWLSSIFPALTKQQLPFFEAYKMSWEEISSIYDTIPRASNLLLITKIMPELIESLTK